MNEKLFHDKCWAQTYPYINKNKLIWHDYTTGHMGNYDLFWIWIYCKWVCLIVNVMGKPGLGAIGSGFLNTPWCSGQPFPIASWLGWGDLRHLWPHGCLFVSLWLLWADSDLSSPSFAWSYGCLLILMNQGMCELLIYARLWHEVVLRLELLSFL